MTKKEEVENVEITASGCLILLTFVAICIGIGIGIGYLIF